MNFNQLLSTMLQRNPNLQQNPMAAQAIECLRSGDAQRGQALAQQICQMYGQDPQQVAAQAKQYFSNMGMR